MTKQLKHTPGPWKAYGTWVSAGVDGDGPLIADCDTDANADLIAAAPDYLAALEEIANMDHDYYCEGYCGVDVAIAALAKAEGEG